MPSSIKEKIGIFGGAFDPPHKGHEKALKTFLSSVDPDLCYVIPSGIPPHKNFSGGAEGEKRLEMSRLAFGALSEKVVVSDEEVFATETTFTYLTVERLEKRHPDSELFLFVGTDQFLGFHTWRKTEYLLSHCTLCVMDRFEDRTVILAKKEALEKDFGARILLLEEKAYIISSTEIREELKRNGFSPSLSASVNELITREGLYGTRLLEKRFSLVKRLLREEGPRRFSHILGVERETARLSDLLGYEKKEDLCLAALYHDSTKHLDVSGHMEVFLRFNEQPSREDLESPAVLHGITAALLAKEDKILSEEAVSAIRWHTTGREGMTLGDKILFFADYIEETREHPGCREMREKFYAALPESFEERRAWLDTCLVFVMEETVKYLNDNKKKIHPMTLRAKRDLERKENQ